MRMAFLACDTTARTIFGLFSPPSTDRKESLLWENVSAIDLSVYSQSLRARMYSHTTCEAIILADFNLRWVLDGWDGQDTRQQSISTQQSIYGRYACSANEASRMGTSSTKTVAISYSPSNFSVLWQTINNGSAVLGANFGIFKGIA